MLRLQLRRFCFASHPWAPLAPCLQSHTKGMLLSASDQIRSKDATPASTFFVTQGLKSALSGQCFSIPPSHIFPKINICKKLFQIYLRKFFQKGSTTSFPLPAIPSISGRPVNRGSRRDIARCDCRNRPLCRQRQDNCREYPLSA